MKKHGIFGLRATPKTMGIGAMSADRWTEFGIRPFLTKVCTLRDWT